MAVQREDPLPVSPTTAPFPAVRQDAGLAALLGYTLPAAETARQWLDRFHEDTLLADRPLQGSFIPSESRWLAGLASGGAVGVVTELGLRVHAVGSLRRVYKTRRD